MDSIFFISPVSEHKFLFLELLFDGLSTNLQLLHLQFYESLNLTCPSF